MADTADAIIIGAGVHGASVAFHLAERGLRPVVLERDTAACGATGRSSGLVRMHYDFEADARLALMSHTYFQDWAERVGGDCGWVRTGFILIAREEDEQSLNANVSMLRSIGVRTRVIDASRCASSFRVS
jgi:sarcosine oxidase, subunit beta